MGAQRLPPLDGHSAGGAYAAQSHVAAAAGVGVYSSAAYSLAHPTTHDAAPCAPAAGGYEAAYAVQCQVRPPPRLQQSNLQNPQPGRPTQLNQKQLLQQEDALQRQLQLLQSQQQHRQQSGVSGAPVGGRGHPSGRLPTGLSAEAMERLADIDPVRNLVTLETKSRGMELVLDGLKKVYERKDRALLGTKAEMEQIRAELAHLKHAENIKTILNHQQHIDALAAKLVAQQAAAAAQQAELAALKAQYKGVQDENRGLFNEVQDLKGNIRVFCRIRPAGATGDSSAACTELAEDNELLVHDIGRIRKGKKAQPAHAFKFDRVFGEHSSQEDMYEETQPLVRSVMDGFNVCIFAYGQTGSGKTHTMSGTNFDDPTSRGINFRALDDLFGLQTKRAKEVQYTIRAQMLEIYNDGLRDLLADHNPSAIVPKHAAKGPKLEILSTMTSGSNVPGAVQQEVSRTEDVIRMLQRGSKSRATAATGMNDRSSRSHMILSIIVHGHVLATRQHTFSCLHLIDLAGSERVQRSGATGERLKEAVSINSSLAALGDVMAALGSKDPHVPFRNSKLTQLLQDSLSGGAKVLMLVHVAPEATSYSETLSSLKFGSRVSEIILGPPKKVVESSDVFAARKIRAELESVKAQLAVVREEKQALQQRNEVLAEENEELLTREAAATAREREAREREQALSQELGLVKGRLKELKTRYNSSAGTSVGPATGSPLSTLAVQQRVERLLSQNSLPKRPASLPPISHDRLVESAQAHDHSLDASVPPSPEASYCPSTSDGGDGDESPLSPILLTNTHAEKVSELPQVQATHQPAPPEQRHHGPSGDGSQQTSPRDKNDVTASLAAIRTRRYAASSGISPLPEVEVTAAAPMAACQQRPMAPALPSGGRMKRRSGAHVLPPGVVPNAGSRAKGGRKASNSYATPSAARGGPMVSAYAAIDQLSGVSDLHLDPKDDWKM